MRPIRIDLLFPVLHLIFSLYKITTRIIYPNGKITASASTTVSFCTSFFLSLFALIFQPSFPVLPTRSLFFLSDPVNAENASSVNVAFALPTGCP